MPQENLIEILLDQHQKLRTTLEQTQELDAQEHAMRVVKNLNNFKDLLTKHLYLEDNVFYPEIIEKMEAKNMNTAQTKIFIDKMRDIATTVMEFLDKYNQAEKVSGDKNFSGELETIYKTYLVRMTSEEDGVYLYWNL